jgi:RimJ/RimL family protein N-acetyltransferase
VPLRGADDAEELQPVLDDPALHEFIGGEPATLPELQRRFDAMAAGSGRAGEQWLNWVVRLSDGGNAIGTVQATVIAADPATTEALVAWVIGTGFQGRGYASEAAAALVEWLRQHGVDSVAAHIHPDHAASGAVAARAGLAPTDRVVDGEIEWRR